MWFLDRLQDFWCFGYHWDPRSPLHEIASMIPGIMYNARPKLFSMFLCEFKTVNRSMRTPRRSKHVLRCRYADHHTVSFLQGCCTLSRGERLFIQQVSLVQKTRRSVSYCCCIWLFMTAVSSAKRSPRRVLVAIVLSTQRFKQPVSAPESDLEVKSLMHDEKQLSIMPPKIWMRDRVSWWSGSDTRRRHFAAHDSHLACDREPAGRNVRS